MDLLDTIIYTAARIALMLGLVLLGAFVGELAIPALATFLPYSALSVKEFIINDTVDSVAAMVLVCIIFIWIFYDDGRKHTAYENWSAVNISIVLLLMLAAYFIPGIFRDSFHQEGKADVFYRILYYPVGWLIERSSGYLMGVLLGAIIMLSAALAAYVAAFKRYIKKHPVLAQAGERRKLSELAEEVELEDEDADPDAKY